MATSEHVIMQNEALVALALIAALELGKYPSVKLTFSYFYLGWNEAEEWNWTQTKPWLETFCQRVCVYARAQPIAKNTGNRIL